MIMIIDWQSLKKGTTDEVTIFEEAVGGIDYALGEEQPGAQSGDEPENIRIISASRVCLESYLKHKYIKKHRDDRLDKCPHNSEEGTCEPHAEVISGKLHDESFVVDPLFNYLHIILKKHKHYTFAT